MDAHIKNAFVLGAGLGTRLRQLTAHCPKPLIPVCNKPLITYAFDHLIRSGISRFVVNTHHRHESYSTAFPEMHYLGVPIIFRYEPVLLETAGGIKNVEELLTGEPFIVYNGDVLTNLPIEAAIRHHLDCGNEVTLILRSSGGTLSIGFDEPSGRISSIGPAISTENGRAFLFTGIYIVHPRFFSRISHGEKISVIPIFRGMIQNHERLGGIVIDEGEWWDLGTREQYLAVHQYLKTAPASLFPGGEWLNPHARVDRTAQVSGATCVGAGTAVGENVVIDDCILWEDVEIASGASLKRCIITSGQRVGGTHVDVDF